MEELPSKKRGVHENVFANQNRNHIKLLCFDWSRQLVAAKTGVLGIAGDFASGREEVSSRVGTALPTPISAGGSPPQRPKIEKSTDSINPSETSAGNRAMASSRMAR